MTITPCAQCPFLTEKYVPVELLDLPGRFTLGKAKECMLGATKFPNDIYSEIASDCPCTSNEEKKNCYKSAKIIERFLDEEGHKLTKEAYNAFSLAEDMLLKYVDSGGNIS